MQNLLSYLPCLCLIAAAILFLAGGLEASAASQNAQGGLILIAGSVALLASAVSARQKSGQ